jgi:predicted nucleic acid-binding protein
MIFKIIETPAPPAQILAWDLGQGETAVLSYALARPKWVAVLDDGAARRCARSLSLKITGTLTVVLLAKQYELIDSAAQVLHDLRSADFRLDDKTIRDALERTVGEKWKAGK